MRKKLAALVGTVLLAGGTLVSATSASAAPARPAPEDWDYTWTTSDAAPHGGTVYIEEHGDVVEVCDTAADGYTPRVMIMTQASNGQYNLRYVFAATGGNGGCVVHRATDGGVYDLPENDNIDVSVYLGTSVGYKGSEHIYYNNQ
jgi:hypothetical protein